MSISIRQQHTAATITKKRERTNRRKRTEGFDARKASERAFKRALSAVYFVPEECAEKRRSEKKKKEKNNIRNSIEFRAIRLVSKIFQHQQPP